MTSLRRLARDNEGAVTDTLMGFVPSWFLTFGVFLMNTQLDRIFVERDFVDHAAALAADATLKVLCANPADFDGQERGEATGARREAVYKSFQPLLALQSDGPRDCRLVFKNSGGSVIERVTPGEEVLVEVSCDFPCDIPFSGPMVCSGSPPRVTFMSSQVTKPMGCDMR